MRLTFILLLVPALAMPVFADPPEGKITIPEGYVLMGTDKADLEKEITNRRVKPEWYADETPQKKVKVSFFTIDATEVTNEAYKKQVQKHNFPPNLAKHPVVNITWKEAREYCQAVGGRLPTEAEWERAARGDSGLVYPWGNAFVAGNVVYAETGGVGAKLKVGSYSLQQSGSSQLGGTKDVGLLESGKSPFGLYDMAGNVWEWVAGWYDKKKQFRLLKGGSWLSPRESVRSATRLGDVGDVRFNDYGFRCAYDIEP